MKVPSRRVRTNQLVRALDMLFEYHNEPFQALSTLLFEALADEGVVAFIEDTYEEIEKRCGRPPVKRRKMRVMEVRVDR